MKNIGKLQQISVQNLALLSKMRKCTQIFYQKFEFSFTFEFYQESEILFRFMIRSRPFLGFSLRFVSAQICEIYQEKKKQPSFKKQDCHYMYRRETFFFIYFNKGNAQ
jgi:hypothetical protein